MDEVSPLPRVNSFVKRMSEEQQNEEKMKKYQEEIKNIIDQDEVVPQQKEDDVKFELINKQPNYIRKEDILETDLIIMEDLGDLDERERDFEDLMNDHKMDFKYLTYNDMPNALEHDKE